MKQRIKGKPIRLAIEAVLIVAAMVAMIVGCFGIVIGWVGNDELYFGVGLASHVAVIGLICAAGNIHNKGKVGIK